MRSTAAVVLVVAVIAVLGAVVYVATRPADVPGDGPRRDSPRAPVDPVSAAWMVLGGLVASGDEESRALGLELVSKIPDDRVPRMLQHAMEDDSEPLVRVVAAGLLARAGRKDLAPFVTGLARKADDWDVYREAAIAYGRIGTPECVPLLVNLLMAADEMDVDEEGQSAAALWLARLGAREAVPALRKTMEETDDEAVSHACAAALLALGETDVVKTLEDACEDSAEEIAPALAVPGSDGVLPVLSHILGDEEGWEDERGLAAISLAEVGTPKARDILEKAWAGLDDEAKAAGTRLDELRAYLAAAFARLDDDRGASLLEKASGTEDMDLLVRVLEAAARLGKGVSVERLVEIATAPREENRTGTQAEEARAWAARAIVQRKK